MGLLSKIFRRKKTKHEVSTPTVIAPSSGSTIDESLAPTTSQTSVSSNPKEHDVDDTSTFADPSPSGVMEWNDGFAAGYCDQSIYGGSVSSEGLTLGNQSLATSAFFSVADGNRSRCMSDDASFFEQSCQTMNVEVLHVFAPPGKLGIALDTPDNSGAPIVHYVKEVSPIHGKIQAGDKLIAIDDEDVSYLTAVKISKILNRKSNNITRKLTVLRAMS